MRRAEKSFPVSRQSDTLHGRELDGIKLLSLLAAAWTIMGFRLMGVFHIVAAVIYVLYGVKGLRNGERNQSFERLMYAGISIVLFAVTVADI